MNKRRYSIYIGGFLALLGGVTIAWPLGIDHAAIPSRSPAPDLRTFPTDNPKQPIDLLFLHHDAGALLLADSSPTGDGKPAGGGLRRTLESAGYRVHSAGFGSKFGENNYLFDWLPKFRDHFDAIARIEHQDQLLPEMRRNRVVMFKSCRVNTLFTGEGTAPGAEAGPELTVENAKATFRAMLDVFAKHPEVLFVYVTSPPFGPPKAEKLGSVALKRLLGKPTHGDQVLASARLNREFHDWVVSPEGWLAGDRHRNVVVFDYYDYLTRNSASLFLAYGLEGPDRDTVSPAANQAVSGLLLPFLNRAIKRAGLD